MAFALLGIPAVVTATGYLSLRLAKTIEVTALALAQLSPHPIPAPARVSVCPSSDHGVCLEPLFCLSS